MKKILIVDDNTQILYMLQTLLSEQGYGVVAAANGAEALEKAWSERPDMIITDILMPVMDGFQLCREWKRDGRLKDVPFVFYTATYTDPKDEELALGLGAERFIVKPAETEAFLGILKEVFEAHKAGRLAAPCEPQHDETVYFREYNEALIRKLEAKMEQVEEANRRLEREVAAGIRTEEAMRESEEKYRALIETTNTGFVILDFTGKVLDANDEYARLTGHERRDEILGRSVFEWTAAYDKARNAKAVEECVRQGVVRNLELDYAGPQGQIIPVEINATLVTIKNEPQTLALCRNITDRKQAGDVLQRSEENNRRLARENEIIAAIGRIVSSTLDIEQVFPRFFDQARQLVPSDHLTVTLLNPRDKTVNVAYSAGVKIPGHHQGAVLPPGGSLTEEVVKRQWPIIITLQDEKTVAAEYPYFLPGFHAGLRILIGAPLFSGNEVIGSLFFGSLTPNAYTEAELKLAEKVSNQIAGAIANAQLFAEHERSEKEKEGLQEQLRQSQKMEAIGRLAGGVAHDFNNLLTVIMGYCELSLLDLSKDDPGRQKLKEIEKAADRAANLTRQLLAFSRRQILEMKVINLNIILENLDKMLRRVIGEDIELTTILAVDLGMAKVDLGQMEQVIVNLAVNAKDAMPRGGKLSLETANVELDEGYTRSRAGMITGDYVMLSVSDSGVGMSKEVQEQIFDPFFTTKGIGKGTGLGLSTVYGIVKQSGGDIFVYSEVGKGTTFKIYLPRVFESPEELKKEVPVEKIPQGNETVLVVEDDGSVRQIAVDILRMQGYKVLEATGGEEALIICEKEKDPIHLILTDVVMPQMDGPQVIERLMQVRQDFKALYMSGYADEVVIHHKLLERGIPIIHKPFTVEKLARKVREVLDKK